jgi:hypothetical protein
VAEYFPWATLYQLFLESPVFSDGNDGVTEYLHAFHTSSTLSSLKNYLLPGQMNASRPSYLMSITRWCNFVTHLSGRS